MKPTLNKKNVVGMAVGEKWVNGKTTGRKAILVFVEKKEPLSALHPDDIIESTINGLPTDVVGRTGKISALALPRVRAAKIKASASGKDSKKNKKPSPKVPPKPILKPAPKPTKPIAVAIYKVNPRAKRRPIIGGLSVSHGNVTAGTIAYIFKNASNKPVILSNNHVLSNANNASIGDAIYQPGTYDAGRKASNIIGRLLDYTILKDGVGHDSAIASVTTTSEATINYIGKPIGLGAAAMNMAVKKSGRTTGLTNGKVIATNGTFRVWYSDTISYLISGCIVTNSMCSGGDSGSLLLSSKNVAIGLLFAGSDSITLHNPIQQIVNRYKLKL